MVTELTHTQMEANTLENGKDGKENGQGTYTWVSGNTWLNGNKYVGEYKNGKPHGQGTYTWANGNKYVGEFKDAKRNGLGIDNLRQEAEQKQAEIDSLN